MTQTTKKPLWDFPVLNSYDEWEEAVTVAIKSKLSITTSDAQGMVEVQYFYLSQAWCLGLTAENAAVYVLIKTGLLSIE